MKNSLTRFSNRTEDYIKYRPHYPQELFLFLQNENLLKKNSIVADIGSGTGIFTNLLLQSACTIFAVEPNDEMRKGAEKRLGQNKNFISIKATAENTTLAKNSIELITVAQAFHWFDKEKCKQEFLRIGKQNCCTALIWNDRKIYSEGFCAGYEKILLEFGTDYKEINHQAITASAKIFDNFFGVNKWKEIKFYNKQELNFEGLTGRITSSSYMPDKNSPSFPALKNVLQKLFDEYAQQDIITMEYETKVFYGWL